MKKEGRADEEEGHYSSIGMLLKEVAHDGWGGTRTNELEPCIRSCGAIIINISNCMWLSDAFILLNHGRII